MKYKIEFDRDYGIDKRTGWSICVDGHYIVQLEKHFLMALIKAVGLNRWLCRFFFLLKLLVVYPLTIFLDFMISKTTDITFADSKKETIQKIWDEWDKIKSA